MKLGLLSDTHGFLDPKIPGLFAGVDHILHAGDVGPQSLLLELEAIAPVTAVLGNTDVWLPLKLTELVELEGRKFLLHHIVDPLALNPELKARVAVERPDAVIFGHTHKRFYGRHRGTLFFNPGYAGRPKPGQERSVAILHDGQPDFRVEYLAL